MQIALRRYEENLKRNKESKEVESDLLTEKLNSERMLMLAEKRAKLIQQRTLSDLLQTQIKQKVPKEKHLLKADLLFKEQGRNKNIENLEKNLVNDLYVQVKEKNQR